MTRHLWTVACLRCWRAVMRLAGVSYVTSRSPASLHTCCQSTRISLMSTGRGRVFPVLNSALSDRTALVISLLTVTIGINCFCLLCQVYLCVLCIIDFPCNSVLNTTKGLNQLNIYLFIRQTSRLCTSTAEEFNKGLPEIGADLYWSWGHRIFSLAYLSPDHIASSIVLLLVWSCNEATGMHCKPIETLLHFYLLNTILSLEMAFYINISVDNALNGLNLFHFSLSSSKSEADRMRVWGILHPGHSLVQWDRRMPEWMRWEKLWKR